MTIFAIMIVRNEADILRTNVLYHQAIGVDRFIVLNNGSIDETGAVLRSMSKKGFLQYYNYQGPFHEVVLATSLARLAIERGASWIMRIDADEFWYVSRGSLRDILATTHANAIRLKVLNFVQRREQIDKTSTSLLTMTQRPTVKGTIDSVRQLVGNNQIAYVEAAYPPKWAVRALPGVEIGVGGHIITNIDGPFVDTHEILCLHAPLRARAILEAKMSDHAARAKELGYPPKLWWQAHRWRDLYAQGKLDEEWAANSYAQGQLNVYGKTHEVTADYRLRDSLTPWIE